MPFVDTFTLSTAVATTTQSRTGYGFQAAALMFVYSYDVSSGTCQFGVGFATSTSNRCSSVAAQQDTNGMSSADLYCSRDNASIARVLLGSDGSQLGAWDLDSIDADGITIIVDDQFTGSVTCTVTAWSSDEVFEADILDWTTDTTTGSDNVTGASVSFPNCAIHAVAQSNTFCIGASANSPAIQNAVLGMASTHSGAQTSARSLANETECTAFTNSSGTVVGRTRVTSWLSGGFVNTVDEGTTALNVYTLLLRVGSASIGSFQSETSVTTFTETADVRPISLHFFSSGETEDATDSAHTHAKVGIGAYDGSNQAAHAFRSEHAVASSNVEANQQTDSTYLSLQNTTDAIEGEASITSVSGSTINLSQDDADTSAAFVWYLAIGSRLTQSAPFFF